MSFCNLGFTAQAHPIASVFWNEKLIQHRFDVCEMVSHADQPSDLNRIAGEGTFARVVEVQTSAIRQVFHERQMTGVNRVIAYVEWVEVDGILIREIILTTVSDRDLRQSRG